jgi:hypothetical protein
MIQNPQGNGNHTAATTCPTWQGHALPGGFGLLETVSGNPCKIVEYSNNWLHTDSGSSTGCDLNAYVGKVVNLPIFDCTASSLPTTAAIPPPGGDCTNGNGNNAWYHRQGYALFYLSGFNVTTSGGVPNQRKSLVSNTFPCSNPNSCISGWFLSGELSATGNFGSYAVVPAG